MYIQHATGGSYGFLTQQEYDPSLGKADAERTLSGNERLQPQATEEGRKYGAPSNYQEKYRKMLGGLDCAEKSAVKMQPNKAFGYGKLLAQLAMVRYGIL